MPRSYQFEDKVRIRPLPGPFGAMVEDLKLGGEEDEGLYTALAKAVGEEGLLVLRGQHLEPASLLAVTRKIGRPLILPYVRPMDGFPELIAVLKEAEEQKISVFGGDWHTDFSFLERPPALTLLYGVELPDEGGDTLFVDMRRAYDGLPKDLRDDLAGRKAVHSGHVYGARNPPGSDIKTSKSIAISRNNSEADKEQEHPVVRRHPDSGEAALFVNPIYTTRLQGMTEEESRPLLSELYAHACREASIQRWRWQKGDLVIWDNRIVMHCASNDYDGKRRLLWRSTTEGERPIAANGGQKSAS